MEIPYFGTTVINGLALCPDQAITDHLRRIEEGNDDLGSNPTRFGTIVHEVAEIAHKYDSLGEACPDPIDIFDDVWRKHHLTDFDYHTIGRDNVAAFIDRTLFNRNGVTIATEWKFVIDLNTMEVTPLSGMTKAKVNKLLARIRKNGGVPVVSMIDRIDKISDDEYEVYDYKTNIIPFTRDEVDESKQLCIYSMAVKSHFAAENVKCIYDLFRHGRQSTEFSDEDTEAIRSYIVNLWFTVKEWEFAAAELNQYCCWCNKRLVCPIYIAATEGLLMHAWAPGDDVTDQQLFNELQSLKDQAKVIDKRVKEFDSAIMARIQHNEGKPIDLGTGEEVYLMTNPRYEYPISSVIPILQAHRAISVLKFCGSVSKPQLDRHLKGRDKLQTEIEATLVTNFVKPTVKKRKIKK